MLLGILNAQAEGGGGATYELLETYNATGSPSSVTFSNVSQDYKNLQIRISARTAGGGVYMQFNDDTSNNYVQHVIYRSSSGVSSGANLNQPSLSWNTATNSDTAGNFSAHTIDLADYTNTNKLTTGRSVYTLLAGQVFLTYTSHLWRNTDAITTIRVLAEGSFTNDTRISLYGIRG